MNKIDWLRVAFAIQRGKAWRVIVELWPLVMAAFVITGLWVAGTRLWGALFDWIGL